jgi:hypothetical protein
MPDEKVPIQPVLEDVYVNGGCCGERCRYWLMIHPERAYCSVFCSDLITVVDTRTKRRSVLRHKRCLESEVKPDVVDTSVPDPEDYPYTDE